MDQVQRIQRASTSHLCHYATPGRPLIPQLITHSSCFPKPSETYLLGDHASRLHCAGSTPRLHEELGIGSGGALFSLSMAELLPDDLATMILAAQRWAGVRGVEFGCDNDM